MSLLASHPAWADSPDPLVAQTLQNYGPIAIQQYARIAFATYSDARDEAKKLRDAAGAMVKEPTPGHTDAARAAWLAARRAFAPGTVILAAAEPFVAPNDHHEALIPSLDPGSSPEDVKQSVDSLKNLIRLSEAKPNAVAKYSISDCQRGALAGYQVIERLLWDTAARPVSDQNPAPSGLTEPILPTICNLLVQDLELLVSEWSPENPNNYCARFLALPPPVAVQAVLNGLYSHCAEFSTRAIESEVSGFSDSSRIDNIGFAAGVANLFYGRFSNADGTSVTSGPGLYSLLLQAANSHPLHPTVGAIRLKAAVDSLLSLANGLPESFHGTAAEPKGSPGRKRITEFKDAIAAAANEFQAFANQGLGLSVGAASSKNDEKAMVIAHYCDLAHAIYEDSLVTARELKIALEALVAHPSAASLDAARHAWLKARTPYSQSEVYRFYAGPVDGENGPEGLLNSWPIDESYIDSVKDQPNSGIINDLQRFPTISADLLTSLNQKDGEANVSVGYHAIEFLLWGQDFRTDGPGERPFTDYIDGSGGTAPNAARRGQYLVAVADLLVHNLESLVDAWVAGRTDNFRAKFVALPPAEALKDILTGMGMLGAVELAGERILVAYDTQVQKEEQSCFSDNTNNDIVDNAQGIANIFYGRYTRVDGSRILGPGILDLARQTYTADPLGLDHAAEIMLADVRAIPSPFDQAILGSDSAPGRQAINTAVSAITKFSELIADFGSRLGLKINITSLKDGDE